MKVSLIVAHNEKNVIGRDNKLPWHLPEDLARFKELTLGKAVIMGRRTYESIGKGLPGRRNIVVTSRPNFTVDRPSVLSVSTLDEALSKAKKLCYEEAFVIGGEYIYKEVLDRDLVDTMYITVVHNEYGGDAYFPDVDYSNWNVCVTHANEYDGLKYTFLKLERLNGH